VSVAFSASLTATPPTPRNPPSLETSASCWLIRRSQPLKAAASPGSWHRQRPSLPQKLHHSKGRRRADVKIFAGRLLPKDRLIKIDIPRLDFSDEAIDGMAAISRAIAEGHITPTEGAALSNMHNPMRVLSPEEAIDVLRLLKSGEENWLRRDRHRCEIMAKVDRTATVSD
jgi:hypothetical protein